MLVQDLPEPDCNSLEVATGQPPVGWEALGENEYVAFLVRQVRVVRAEETADVAEGVLFGGHRAAVSVTEHLAGYVDDRSGLVTGLALLDEV